jgi:hypothetical protein
MTMQNPNSNGFDREKSAAKVGEYQAGLAKLLADEAARIEAARGMAWGVMRAVQNLEVLRGGMVRRDGFHLEVADPLSVICAQAHRKWIKKGRVGVFVPPLSAGQVAVGRLYASLSEWREGSGVKCQTLDGRTGGGGAGLFIDTFLDRGAELARMRGRIGHGAAMAVRRVRPSKRAALSSIYEDEVLEGERVKARLISDRALVDGLLVAGQTLSEVLDGHGWAANGKHRGLLMVALCGALDRMQGIDPQQTP